MEYGLLNPLKTMAKSSKTIHISLVLLFIIGILIFLSGGCNSDKDLVNSPSSESIKKVSSKLDSPLNQLVNAYYNGNLSSFAVQNNIKLIKDKVRVIIECVPDQIEKINEIVTRYDAVVEISYENLLQVVIPVTELNTLENESCIRFIRLPNYALPATTNKQLNATKRMLERILNGCYC